MTHDSPPLSHSLLAGARALAQVQAGWSLTEALAEVPDALRPSAQALTFYAMRHWGRAIGLRSQLVQRVPPNETVYALIGLSLCLLDVAMEAEQTAPEAGAPLYTAHTLVDQSVQATQWQQSMMAFKGLVNAVLRRFQRERPTLVAALSDDQQARWNHQGWWVQALQKAYPEDWQRILTVDNTHPPLTLRVNTRRVTRQVVQDALTEKGLACSATGAAGLVLDVPRPIASLPGYAQGWWSVQDAGAQLAAPLLEVRDGMRVLDACAAPGGKAAHLLELADIELTALDVEPGRLARVEQNFERLGLRREGVTLVAADASRTQDWWDGKPFDAVLADVPCTASGIVRRHPDIRWLRRSKDIRKTVQLQREILDALWGVVAPGGKLLLVTCSIFPEEGEMLAKWFLARHTQAERLAAPGQLLPSEPSELDPAGHDGFFYALFSRRV